MLLRDANPSDFPQILELNEASVNFLSPLTPVRLEHLHKEAAYHRVLETDGNVAAFLLAFREGCAYDSPNYRWFAENYDKFIYIDRIVVCVAYQGRGIGHRFYTDLFSFARQTNASRVTCEFDIDPPNDRSRRFHERYGFKEVGTQSVASGKKQVSLRALSLKSDTVVESPPGPRQ
jgi:predicted GNAT superfamily acetyltransferase